MKCGHKTALFVKSFRRQRLTLMLCTWACMQPYWMRTAGHVSFEVSAKEATKILVDEAPKDRLPPAPKCRACSRPTRSESGLCFQHWDMGKKEEV